MVQSLKTAGVAVAECIGVEPNPRITAVRRGVDIARLEGWYVVIALGGGSTMDASKLIAAAVLYEGDHGDMIGHGQGNWVILYRSGRSRQRRTLTCPILGKRRPG